MVWLVLEYCQGDELYNYLLKHGRLPTDKVQKTFAQLVGAVSYVHLQSCVHRDLKLENILLDKHENVKLVDFGFTREYEGKSNYLQTFCGTICYSAPEMLKGEKYAGEKVDVWSLGIILYALLCGELPFDDDDDNETRRKILAEEPKYPDHIPAEALALLKVLLSKRPFKRPTLPDILSHPFLAEHAPHQQAVLKLEKPAPFSTPLEKETLQRMRSAGVDIDVVIESVLSQRCDVLAGWWTLLIEKEERKHARRERKRKEKEQEHRISRRLSTASSRLERLATVGEEASGSNFVRIGEPPPPRTRGRAQRRSGHYDLHIEDFPGLKELGKFNGFNGGLSPEGEHPPPPIDKDSVRSASSSRHRRPIPPPKEGVLRSARSRGSTLHLVTTSDAVAAQNEPRSPPQKVRKKPSQIIVAHWKNWTHWFVERRHKDGEKRGSRSTPNLLAKANSAGKDGKGKDASPRPQTSKYPNTAASGQLVPPKGNIANGSTPRASGGLIAGTPLHSPGSALSTPSHSGAPRMASGSYKRHSISPSPLTPRSTVRRSSAGLRGRKSTSSSVSSIRSIHHHHHSHSKASSISSSGSVSTSMSKTTLQGGRSPHHSVKVLPATPTTGSFPSNLRLVRGLGPPVSIFNESMPSGSSAPNPPGSPNPFNSPGPSIFAKRKRNIFKGPMLAFGGGSSSRSTGSGSHSRSASASGQGRRSGEAAIQEVDEDAIEDDYAEEDGIEEVDQFSPIIRAPGELVTEEIYEDSEATSKGGGSEAVSPLTEKADQTFK
jgi:serine/threonine protein kinase